MPDGDQIAVARDGGDPFLGSIVLVNADGSGEPLLLPPGENVGGPVWSPDGSQIAFIRSDVELGLVLGGIWVMDANGKNAHALPAGAYSEPSGLDWAAAP